MSAVRSFIRKMIPRGLELPVAFVRSFLSGTVEPELWLVKKWANSSAIAVDIGANRGVYSLWLSKWFQRVFAFEPNPRMAAILTSFKSPKIEVQKVALSSSCGEAELHVPVNDSGVEYAGWGSLIQENLPPSHAVHHLPASMRTLDSYNLENVAFIKIDVEGNELETVSGAMQTIQQWRPILLIEIRPASRPAFDDLFRRLRYQAFVVATNGQLVRVAKPLEQILAPSENVFAVPNERC